MKIAVLHARQPLTTDLREVFPEAECVVVSAGEPAVREDAGGEPPQVIRADRGDWAAALAEVRPDEVVTNDEYALADCAGLRDGLGLAARLPAYPLNYLDKVTMKRELAAAGITVPRFVAFEPVVARVDAEVLSRVGLPVVVKPRQEANSRGVRVLHTVAELRDWLAAHEGEAGWEAEEFVLGVGHHVNSVVRTRHVEPVQVGRYLGPLLDLPIGSMSVRYDSLHELNEHVVAALGYAEMVVHTELIVRDGVPVVVEVAGRAPGGDVARMAMRHAGINLEAAHLRLQAGLPIDSPHRTDLDAAWVWRRPGELPPVTSPHEVYRRSTIDSVVLWNADPAELERDAVLLSRPSGGVS
ncbi:hypothetical protein AB0M47_06535 [Hamadaea sp. NPDC051192]|uniref:ATP-grasp domain-containing protein n=1 Tax=Hamadaea sp. NPDC051192 TaxID=3154940 RepID=UPI00343C677B